MDIKSTGELIAEERKKSDITQKQLGNMLGVTDMAVSKWERGLCYPDVTLLPQLADILGLTVTEIIQGRRNESPKAANTEEPSQGEKEEIKEPVSEITAEEATREVVEIASKQIKRHKKNTKKLVISLSSAVAAVLIAIVVCLICLLPIREKEETPEWDFYGLEVAYENGFISLDDLKSIAYYFNGEGDEGFIPKAKTPEVLSEETVNSIKKAMALHYDNQMKEHLKRLQESHADSRRIDLAKQMVKEKTDPESISINSYYGTYNGCVAAILSGGSEDYVDLVHDIDIDGVIFHYPNGNYIIICKSI